MYCSKCGSELPNNARFCPVCGFRIHPTANRPPVNDPSNYTYPVTPPQNNKPKKRKKTSMILGIVIGGAAAAIMAICVLLPFNKGTKASSDQTEVFTTPQEKESAADSLFYSTLGRMTRLGNDIYFVQSGIDNDCSENGMENSENIWRISEDINTEPELVASIPSDVYSGVPQNTIYYMTGFKDRLWYLSQRRNYSLNWVSTDGEETGTIELPENIYPYNKCFDNNKYYFFYRQKMDDEQYTNSCFVYDIANETETAFPERIAHDDTKSIKSIVNVSNDYIYYIASSDDETGYEISDSQLCRTLIGSDEYEIIPFDNEELPTSDGFTFATDEYYYFGQDNFLYGYQFATENVIEIINDPDMDIDADPGLYISQEGIWHYTDGEIIFCEPDGSNKKVVSQTSDEFSDDCKLFALCNDWLYYCDDSMNFYRSPSDSTGTLVSDPLVVTDLDSLVQKKENDLWTYTLYPTYAEINGYKGDDETVIVPDEMEGLPVRKIKYWSLSDDGLFTNTKTLVLPDSLNTIHALEIDGLTTVILPAGIEFFSSQNFYYTIVTGNMVNLVYPGTLEQWKAVNERNAVLYGGTAIMTSSKTTTFTIECSDGIFSYDNATNGYS